MSESFPPSAPHASSSEVEGSGTGTQSHARDRILALRDKAEEALGILGKDLPSSEKISVTQEIVAELGDIGRRLARDQAAFAEDAARRNRDHAAHLELLKTQLQHVVQEYEASKKSNSTAVAARDSLQAKVDSLSTSERAMQIQVQSLTSALKHSEASVKAKAEQIEKLRGEISKFDGLKTGSEAQHGPSDVAKHEGEKKELINDLTEGLLDKFAQEERSQEHDPELLLQEMDALKKRLSEEEERVEQMREQIKALEAEREKSMDKSPRSPRDMMLSPRSSDLKGMRRRIQQLQQDSKDKEDEINELHRLLFEMRPQLEKEVKDQVREILGHAEEQAARITGDAEREAATFRDEHVGTFERQKEELEHARVEIEVLRRATAHRDQLLQEVEDLKSQNANLKTEVDRLRQKMGHNREKSSLYVAVTSAGRSKFAYFTLAAAPILLICYWTWGHKLTSLNGKTLTSGSDKAATSSRVASPVEKGKSIGFDGTGVKGNGKGDGGGADGNEASFDLSAFDVIVQALDPEFFDHVAAASTWMVEKASVYSSKTLEVLNPRNLSGLDYEGFFNADSSAMQSMGGVAVGICFGFLLAGQLRWR